MRTGLDCCAIESYAKYKCCHNKENEIWEKLGRQVFIRKNSTEDGLKYYTIHNAYAAFREGKTGSIEKGKYADTVVHYVNLMQMTSAESTKSLFINLCMIKYLCLHL